MVPDISPFHAITLSRHARALEAAGRSIIHMEFGQPTCGAPRAAIEAAHRVLDTDPMGYWESTPLKERIAGHYRATYGVDVAPERIFLTCGASPAFVLALNCLFSPGQAVAFSGPGYVAYRNTVRALHLDPVEIGCGPDTRYQISAGALAALPAQPAGLILSSPANPTGSILPAEEMARIADHCRTQGISIISDEIYHGLCYEGRTACALEYDDRAVIVSSFSKYYGMAGWRLGWLIVPDDLVETAYRRMGNLFLTPPSMAQHAALVAMDATEELEANVAVYRANRQRLVEALPALGLKRIAPPDGAFYIYADISHLTGDSMAFCMELMEDTGVATAPGLDFDPVEGYRFMRFSFALSTAEVEEALARITPWFAARAEQARA